MLAAAASVMPPEYSTFQTLCREYGIPLLDRSRFAGLPPLSIADQKAVLRKQIEKIEGKIDDQLGFFVKFMEMLFDEKTPDPLGRLAVLRVQHAAEVTATLEDLKPVGDKYTATAVGGIDSTPLEFIKINGEWRIEEIDIMSF